MKGDKENHYLLVDVSNLSGAEYWSLVNKLTERNIKCTDADFNDHTESDVITG